MLATRLRRRHHRRGLTAVEAALVMSVFLMLLFGMFEYCRFLMVLHVTNNAAREGARYAVVNVDKPSTFNITNYTYTDAAGATQTVQNIESYTQDRMGGIHVRNIESFRIAVYSVDPTGLTLSPPVVRPKTKTAGTYPDPFNDADANAVPWNSAGFTEKIAVTIDGTYRPLLPTLLLMPSTISVKTTAIMGSEG
ncbi:pilus assembly protein [Gemmata sp. JC717]|uniref:TadE/TadG family type IV pilus assembly protein n=1 Tax=Gemmata algarum TaxID=2975278 RepID=UPI0021BB775E|nr:TadE family protein [Gemmata algarum]MDY3552375.1 pilus assembly protein [Gemmata algarum]